MIVSAMIDQPQERPTRVVQVLEQPRERVLDRGEDAGDDHGRGLSFPGSRPRRGSRGCSGAAATPSATSPGSARTRGRRATSTPSRSGSTCRRGRPATTRVRDERADQQRQIPHAAAFPSTSSTRSPSQSASCAGERLPERGPRDQDVVAAGGNRAEPLAPRLAQAPLDPVPLHRRAGALRHGDPEPRLPLVVAREPVQDEKARRDRPAVAVDRVEIAGAGEAIAALHRGRGQAESRFRPFDRRRLRIRRPARVDMRARKPCLRFRRRTLGW